MPAATAASRVRRGSGKLALRRHAGHVGVELAVRTAVHGLGELLGAPGHRRARGPHLVAHRLHGVAELLGDEGGRLLLHRLRGVADAVLHRVGLPHAGGLALDLLVALATGPRAEDVAHSGSEDECCLTHGVTLRGPTGVAPVRTGETNLPSDNLILDYV